MAKAQLVPPPIEILTEFLCGLSEIVSKHDNVVLILRGSYLLKHWFGDDARPAADIDLECFQRSRSATYDRFGTPMNHAKALCMYAAQAVGYSRANRASPRIEFNEVDVPADGTSLWEYGTPGVRCYTGWVWNVHRVSGVLQIDIAQAGSYDLGYVGVKDIGLVASGGEHFQVTAYTPEMLLAAKVSWLLRGLKRQEGLPPIWNGDPKDLFDAHLLVTEGNLRAGPFEKSMLAVAAEDKLDWISLDVLSDARKTIVTDEDFPNWPAFQREFAGLITRGPAEMLRIVAERVDSLLAGVRAHVPFLLAIDADPVDEVPYLIYADWLQDRGDPRGDFLRLALKWFFHEDELSAKELTDVRRTLKLALQKMSTPWLYHLFGSAERFRELKQRIEA
jgi:uncharacterized protein (TIGR02996 family)